MRIPQKMKEKHSLHFGMIAGLIALPVLWWLQEIVLRLATGYPLPQAIEISFFISYGALPGAVLGAGISQCILARKNGDFGQARGSLLITSCLVLLSVVLTLAFSTGNEFVRFGASVVTITPWPGAAMNPGLYKNFAFQSALLVFFIGLLMRSRR